MDLGNLIWLVFILMALQPVFSRRLQDAMRMRKISLIEKRRGSRAILIIHRQETMRLLGFPVMRYIDLHDSEEVLRAIQLTDEQMPLDIILHTPGGLVIAALQIARGLKRHAGKVTVYVPHFAMSGGTLIALAADEIVMCAQSVLGPIDPQIGGKPAASLIKVAKEKSTDRVDDNTLVLADVGAKAIKQLRKAVCEILEGSIDRKSADKLARTLTSGRWTHDYPITPDEAKALGLNVTVDMPAEILELMALYPQPVQGVPSVEYIPRPREREIGNR